MTISFRYGSEDIVHRTANKDYRSLLSNVIKGGHWIAPRGMMCLELLNAHTLVSMDFPRMTIPERKIGEKFRYAEEVFSDRRFAAHDTEWCLVMCNHSTARGRGFLAHHAHQFTVQ